MGTSFAADRPLSDGERCTLIRNALGDGTVHKLLNAVGWDAGILAQHMNIVTPLAEEWLGGSREPSPYQALKLWAVVTSICTQPPPSQ